MEQGPSSSDLCGPESADTGCEVEDSSSELGVDDGLLLFFSTKVGWCLNIILYTIMRRTSLPAK